MQSILDRVAAGAYSTFRPQTIRDFFALRLAQRLGDAPAARHYVQLTDERSEEQLLVAYRRMLAHPPHSGDLARAFHVALEHVNGQGVRLQSDRLLSAKVERRSVSVAVFIGTELDYTQTRQLSSTREKAEASAAGFINSMMNHFEVESAALERIVSTENIQRLGLSRMIGRTLREYALPVLEIEKRDLLAAFGHPAPRSRREMREVVLAIWPVLTDDGGILDAAALGLFIQTERLFACDA